MWNGRGSARPPQCTARLRSALRRLASATGGGPRRPHPPRASAPPGPRREGARPPPLSPRREGRWGGRGAAGGVVPSPSQSPPSGLGSGLGIAPTLWKCGVWAPGQGALPNRAGSCAHRGVCRWRATRALFSSGNSTKPSPHHFMRQHRHGFSSMARPRAPYDRDVLMGTPGSPLCPLLTQRQHCSDR